MTVQEWFEGERIYREDVDSMGGEGEYQYNAASFIGERWSSDVESLTEKQASWATRILDDMTERRIDAQRRSR